MRLLVCGGRDFNDELIAYKVLDDLRESITVIAHGGATGADSLANLWAIKNKIPCKVYKADWNKYGKCAGILRNIEMLDKFKPTHLLAFPGNRGTADMVERATKANVKILELKW